MVESHLTNTSESKIIADEAQAIGLTFEIPTLRTSIKNVVVYSDHVEGEAAPDALERLIGQKGQLHFSLLGRSWSKHSQATEVKGNTKNTSNIQFQLGRTSRPEPNSRIARRWKTSSLHPIAGAIRNDLSAGQNFTCKIVDLSIGGASLEFEVDPCLFTGQRTQITIYYPLATKSSTLSVEIVSLRNSRELTIARVRFTPITSAHIQSLANHLIQFQLSVPLSSLELDLENTDWPKSRIETFIKYTDTSYNLVASINGEDIASAKATPAENGKLLTIRELKLSNLWPASTQLSCLLTELLASLSSQNDYVELELEDNEEDLWLLGFRRTAKKQWSMPISAAQLSGFRRYQRKSYAPISSDLKPQTNTTDKAFKIYESLRPRTKKDSVSWDQYGLVYDKMCAVNSSYQELLAEYRRWISSQQTEIKAALDLGAGTGNFVLEAASALPFATVEHVDQDAVMNFFAQEKYIQAGIENVRITTIKAADLSIQNNQLDLVTAIHSIYTLPNPMLVLKNIYNWLKPGGLFYVADIGRTINTSEWSKHIFIENAKSKGLIETTKYFWNARAAITQNKKIQATQNSGTYWNRSHEEFLDALKTTGFEIVSSKVTYRGNSDLAICKKPEVS